jgi:gamma-glutamyl-gamma-aminobutyrate hydrolase PuuD
VTADAHLADALGQAVAQVSSYYHQSLQNEGAGLRVSTVCGDVIEAAEATGANIVAAQWYPNSSLPPAPNNVHCSSPS